MNLKTTCLVGAIVLAFMLLWREMLITQYKVQALEFENAGQWKRISELEYELGMNDRNLILAADGKE